MAPVRGAGGRFIRREEKGQPFAAGLKALDPAAHARGVALSAEAERQAREAEAQAALAYWADEKSSAFDALNRALRKVLDLREERKTNPDRLSDEDFDSIEWAMGITAAAAGDALEAVSAEHRRAFEELHGLAAAGHSGTAR